MKSELQKGSRSRILARLMFIIMAVFVVRLFFLQIIQHDYYVGQADNEQIKRLTIPAKRGLIYALDGNKPVELVMNETVYTVFADPSVTNNDAKIASTIRQIAGGSARSDLEGLLSNKESRYQVLATKVSRAQADMIKAVGLKGIGFQENSQRVYPEGGLGAQVLGFLDYNGVGQYGVEGKLNDRLTGTDGLLQSVTDVSDVPLTIGNNNIKKPAVNGDNLVLTIDRNVQSHVEQALADGLKRTKATNASAIVIDPQTGKIMAMANLPSYSPGDINSVTDVSVFNNPIVSSPYEPGSDMKTLTMAVGVDKGVVTPSSTYNNLGYMDVDGIRVLNGVGLDHFGTITLQTAMDHSLNSGFITVAERLGDGSNITLQARNTMYDYFYNKFKLGQLTGVEVTGEQGGTIIPPSDPQGNAVRYSNMSFGQGLDLTMLQVASAFSSIVDGGQYHQPTVVDGVVDETGNFKLQAALPTHMSVSKSTADQVREMTHITRNTLFGGTDKPGYEIGGKTGTSQTLINGNYDNNQTVGTYLGYGGNDTPRYVIMVQVSGKGMSLQGGRDAQPIFTDISNWMLGYLRIQPKE